AARRVSSTTSARPTRSSICSDASRMNGSFRVSINEGPAGIARPPSHDRKERDMTSQSGAVPPARNSYAPDQDTIYQLRERAQFSRLESIRLIDIAKTGHYTSVFSAAEVFSALYYDVMKLRKGQPHWDERDRFTIGKGHAAVGLFPIYADLD